MKKRLECWRQGFILRLTDFFEKRFGIEEGMLYKDMTKFQRVISEIEDILCRAINKLFFQVLRLKGFRRI